MAFGNTVKNGTGTAYWLMMDDAGHPLMASAWIPALQADEAANDSDKSLTVPASTEWIVKWIWIELTTSADVGDRQIEIQIQDAAADVVAQFRASVVQAASVTRYYLFAPQMPDLAAFRDTDYLCSPIPELILPTGYVIRVWDNKARAAGADDLVVQAMIAARATT